MYEVGQALAARPVRRRLAGCFDRDKKRCVVQLEPAALFEAAKTAARHTLAMGDAIIWQTKQAHDRCALHPRGGLEPHAPCDVQGHIKPTQDCKNRSPLISVKTKKIMEPKPTSNPDREAAKQRNPMPSAPLLFHYTGRVDAENLLRTIAAELFYFSNPLHFNDALDMRMPIQPQRTGEENPNFSIIAGNPARPQNAFETPHPGLTESLSHIISQINSEDIELARVLCTTEKDNNTLMWSHYGNRHQGICFGLDWKLLKTPPIKVHYQDELSLSDMGLARFTWEPSLRARIKTKDWESENEWRLFRRARNKDEVCFMPLRDALKTVTLGCKTSRETRKLVYSLVNRYRPDIEVRQIDVVNGKFLSTPLTMPEKFITQNFESVSKAIDTACNGLLASGQIDDFLIDCAPFLFHLEEIGDKAISCWHPIIAAAQITGNAVLRNRVVHWCPENLASRTKDMQAAEFNTADDEIDVWCGYFSCLKPAVKDFTRITDINAIDDKRPMTLENKKLFLKIGWNVARKIETESKNDQHQSLVKLCESNLKMALKINGDSDDIEKCRAMLTRISS